MLLVTLSLILFISLASLILLLKVLLVLCLRSRSRCSGRCTRCHRSQLDEELDTAAEVVKAATVVAATNFIPRAVIAARTIRNLLVVGDVSESRGEVIETARARLAVALIAILAVKLKVPLCVRLLEMGSQLHLRFEVELATHLTALAAVKVTAASVASAHYVMGSIVLKCVHIPIHPYLRVEY